MARDGSLQVATARRRIHPNLFVLDLLVRCCNNNKVPVIIFFFPSKKDGHKVNIYILSLEIYHRANK